jgi:hypothetical protein
LTVLPNNCPVGIDAEAVVAVGGERVLHRHAAARAERRALDVMHLRAGARHLVGVFRGARLRIANGERADAARRAQVAFHHRRREQLRIRDVVETGAERVGRQERVHVHVEREQRVHRARVLGAIESLEGTTAGIRMERRIFIEARFHRRRKRREHRAFGTPRVRRRHHPRAQLADHFLRDLGHLRVVADLRRIKTGERQSAGVVLVAIVVTGGAVLLDERGLRFGDRHGRVRDRERRRGRLSCRRLSRRSGRSLRARGGG